VYLGFGALYYEIQTVPVNAPAGVSRSGWTGLIPVGVGVQIMVDDLVAVDIGGGYNQSLSGGLDAIKTGKNDSYWNLMIGVAVVGETDPDPDRDGLLTKEEKPIGTDPLNPDTDGDGLNDREEVKGYKTNPLKPDTDGDGLKDGGEVKVYATDPLNPDSDADDLSDGDEVQRFETDPLKRDTDRDALADGAEVLRHKTSPLKIDTDGGTIGDGVEVSRGTNPLDPIDDVARKQALKVEIGKPIILEGVVFKFGSAEITPASDEILTKAFDTMSENPAIEVEIHGHTDNIGKPSYNLKLSQARAGAVKVWLMKRGVAANRIVTKGFGSVKPIASNVTEEGRQRNRRIEFLRVR
jgi:outer membrane protein OmpA-like peptidoglycan-associated protein